MRKLERAYRHTDARQVAGSSQHTYWVTRASLGILWTRSSSTLRIQATLPWIPAATRGAARRRRRDRRRRAARPRRRGAAPARGRCVERDAEQDGGPWGREEGRRPPRGAPRAPSVGRRPATQASGESERLSRVLRRRRRVHKEEGRRVAEAKGVSTGNTRLSSLGGTCKSRETRCRSPSPPEMAHIDE